MKRSPVPFLVGILILVVAGVVLAMTLGSSDKSNTKATPSPTPSTSNSATPNNTVNSDKSVTTITYTDSGFSPAKVTVKAGSKLTFVNKSSEEIKPASDPHPTHTDNPELNMDDISSGSSGTITISKMGSWGMHNHYHPSEKLTVVVQ